jgi:hypothetical protein
MVVPTRGPITTTFDPTTRLPGVTCGPYLVEELIVTVTLRPAAVCTVQVSPSIAVMVPRTPRRCVAFAVTPDPVALELAPLAAGAFDVGEIVVGEVADAVWMPVDDPLVRAPIPMPPPTASSPTAPVIRHRRRLERM